MNFAATPPSIHGTLARFFKLPADMLHPLPESVTDEDGAMMEPLAVAVHAVHSLGQCRSNQVVLVFGAGPVGLLCMAVAKAVGARRVIAVDINQARLDFAKSYAATDVIIPVGVKLYYCAPLSDAQPTKEAGESVDRWTARACEKIRSELGIPLRGAGSIDLVIEGSGAASCVQIGLTMLKPG
jgi:L-iditol 2-dehydrogenase/D-xylulose reductase